MNAGQYLGSGGHECGNGVWGMGYRVWGDGVMGWWGDQVWRELSCDRHPVDSRSFDK